MKKDGMKTASMQSIASNRGTAVCWFPRTARAIDDVLHLRVDVLDLDGRLIDENADRQGQAAQRHEVDRLSGQPHGDRRIASRAKGMLRTTTITLRQIAQEQQHHQAGEDSTQQPSVATPHIARVTWGTGRTRS